MLLRAINLSTTEVIEFKNNRFSPVRNGLSVVLPEVE